MTAATECVEVEHNRARTHRPSTHRARAAARTISLIAERMAAATVVTAHARARNAHDYVLHEKPSDYLL